MFYKSDTRFCIKNAESGVFLIKKQKERAKLTLKFAPQSHYCGYCNFSPRINMF